jgi:hypothetical protein
VLPAGLPDGTISNQKSQFGQILEALGIEKVDIFYGHLEYLHILLPFGIFHKHLVI